MAAKTLRRIDIIEPGLSYRIVGVLFEVSNTLGSGYSESYYQRAIALAFEDAGLKFRKEALLPVMFHGRFIGRQRCDFLVEGKVLVEVKKGAVFSRHNAEQIFNYLKASNLRLGIIANFTSKGVIFKRIVKIIRMFVKIRKFVR